MEEGEGFEPPGPEGPPRFKLGAISRTRPTFREWCPRGDSNSQWAIARRFRRPGPYPVGRRERGGASGGTPTHTCRFRRAVPYAVRRRVL